MRLFIQIYNVVNGKSVSGRPIQITWKDQ